MESKVENVIRGLVVMVICIFLSGAIYTAICSFYVYSFCAGNADVVVTHEKLEDKDDLVYLTTNPFLGTHYYKRSWEVSE